MKHNKLTLQQIYFSTQGRVNRFTYWVYSLPFAIIFILVNIYEKDIESAFEFYWLIYLLLVYPSVAIQIKRWHDRNKSGWWVLINFIPIVSLWALVENGFLKGNECRNDYGMPQDWEAVNPPTETYQIKSPEGCSTEK